jgi:hypothetical protein
MEIEFHHNIKMLLSYILLFIFFTICLGEGIPCSSIPATETCLATVPGTIGTVPSAPDITTTADCTTINTCTDPGTDPTPPP